MTQNADWSPGFMARVQKALRGQGYEDVASFLEANPGRPYVELVQLLGPTIAAKQLTMLHYRDALRRGALRAAAMDSVVRECQDQFIKGWGIDSDFVIAGVPATWITSLKFETDEDGELYEQLGFRIWRKLEALDIPDGWIPESVDDPFLRAAFDEVWPEEEDDEG